MNDKELKGLKNNDLDNVATVFGEVSKGEEVEISDPKGNKVVLKSLNDIPFGHKIALNEIEVGEQITKYGEEIGIASSQIQVGEYVHVHNLESIRGRGDWEKEGGNE